MPPEAERSNQNENESEDAEPSSAFTITTTTTVAVTLMEPESEPLLQPPAPPPPPPPAGPAPMPVGDGSCPELELICCYCGQTLPSNSTMDDLDIHEKSHLGGKGFKCLLCSKQSFLSEELLIVHLRIRHRLHVHIPKSVQLRVQNQMETKSRAKSEKTAARKVAKKKPPSRRIVPPGRFRILREDEIQRRPPCTSTEELFSLPMTTREIVVWDGSGSEYEYPSPRSSSISSSSLSFSSSSTGSDSGSSSSSSSLFTVVKTKKTVEEQKQNDTEIRYEDGVRKIVKYISDISSPSATSPSLPSSSEDNISRNSDSSVSAISGQDFTEINLKLPRCSVILHKLHVPPGHTRFFTASSASSTSASSSSSCPLTTVSKINESRHPDAEGQDPNSCVSVQSQSESENAAKANDEDDGDSIIFIASKNGTDSSNNLLLLENKNSPKPNDNDDGDSIIIIDSDSKNGTDSSNNLDMERPPPPPTPPTPPAKRRKLTEPNSKKKKNVNVAVAVTKTKAKPKPGPRPPMATINNYNGKPLKGYVCLMCGVVCKYPTCLEKHFTIHTKERPYPCDLCDGWFSYQWDRTQHQRRIHGVVIKIKSRAKAKPLKMEIEESVPVPVPASPPQTTVSVPKSRSTVPMSSQQKVEDWLVSVPTPSLQLVTPIPITSTATSTSTSISASLSMQELEQNEDLNDLTKMIEDEIDAGNVNPMDIELDLNLNMDFQALEAEIFDKDIKVKNDPGHHLYNDHNYAQPFPLEPLKFDLDADLDFDVERIVDPVDLDLKNDVLEDQSLGDYGDLEETDAAVPFEMIRDILQEIETEKLENY